MTGQKRIRIKNDQANTFHKNKNDGARRITIFGLRISLNSEVNNGSLSRVIHGKNIQRWSECKQGCDFKISDECRRM